MTNHACPEEYSPHMPGGDVVSHPRKPGTIKELLELGGPEFDDIIALATPALELPPYTPQPRHRRSLRGYLTEDVYILWATAVVKKKRVIPADELRDSLSLESQQRLVLLLFDRDRLLEQMWERGAPLIVELAAAGYDAIISPSFSTYTPRPHTDFMINAKRSLIYFSALQKAGAHVIPRAAWIGSHDARRFAAWAQENPAVEMFAIDLSTYRLAGDWQAQLEGLDLFDSETGRRISYLINGVTTERRCTQLLELLGPDRLHITNATTQARIPTRRLRSTGDQTGATFKARLEVRRGVVERAKDSARRDDEERRAA